MPPFDPPLSAAADYVVSPPPFSDEAYAAARLALLDSIGCALLALRFPACARLLGPIVPGASLKGGARVPGTDFELDPVKAAFDIGTAIRWLDYNDTWLAAEWGHPSDNLGGILALCDYLSRRRRAEGRPPFAVRDVLAAMIQAYEIQGITALENAFNRAGMDHVILVRVATAAVAARLLGGGGDEVRSALSHAWIDGGPLRAYRHAPNTGPRKSWAAGDATSRGVRLALLAAGGEMGYPAALTAKTWGFFDALFRGRPFSFSRPFGCYVMENILFKISFPAEFHAQTAAEAALALHPAVKDRIAQVARVRIETQESAARIIDKRGPLHNPADRDHCLQYITAVPLIFGALNSDHYEDDFARDPRIDALREKMEVVQDPAFTQDYLDPEKRSIGNAVQVFFRDGTATDRVAVEFPIGHRRRRAEGIPLLRRKFQENAATRLPPARAQEILALFDAPSRLDSTPVDVLMELIAGGGPRAADRP